MDEPYSQFIIDAKALLAAENITIPDNRLLSAHLDMSLDEFYRKEPFPNIVSVEERTVGAGGFITFEDQVSLAGIGRLWALTDGDPYEAMNIRAIPANSIKVNGSRGVKTTEIEEGGSVYVTFTPVYTRFRGEDYSSTTTYSKGDVVFSEEYVDFFKALIDSPGLSLFNTAEWEVLRIPEELYKVVLHRAVANFLASVSNARYSFYQANAQMYYEDLLMELYNSQFYRNFRVIKTYSSTTL